MQFFQIIHLFVLLIYLDYSYHLNNLAFYTVLRQY